MRDNAIANTTSGTKTYSTCSVNGIMNAVELDVGNLAKWLNGNYIARWPHRRQRASVTYTNLNGYVLYFSDHRGMLPSTHPSNGGQTPAGVINGESGLEDVVNSSQNFHFQSPRWRPGTCDLLHLLSGRRRSERLSRQLGRKKHRLRLRRQHQQRSAESI